MHQELFKIFGFPIRTFGVMAALGLLLGFWLMNYRARKAGEDPQKMADALFLVMIGALVGARLLYVVRYWEVEFARDFWRIFRINEGGIVFQGGFFGGLLTAWFVCKSKQLDFIKSLDIVAPCLALGHAIGRIGCFFNGCCYGGVCDDSIGVSFPAKSLPWMEQVREGLISPMAAKSLPVYPTQLYSFAANILICLILLFMTARLKVKGHLFSLYLIIYAIWRLSVEFLRNDQDRHFGLSLAQYLAIVQINVGIALWIYFTKKYPAQTTESEDSNAAN